MRVIFHIDLNAFYANAEVSQHPELKGKPIVIAHDSKRSVVSTASYEARKLGIHSAMPLFMAKEKCKDLVIVEPHFDLYHRLSEQFFEIVRSYSPYLQQASIDEGYLDLSERITKTREQPYELAKRMQDEVYAKLGLTCSIGISPNKFLSKMASDMKKPMGITIITKRNIQEVLWPLDVGEMHGIGKKTAPRLHALGINTIGDLANYDNYGILKQVFGKNALIVYQRANGKDESKVHYEESDAKSVSTSETFEEDIEGMDTINETFKHIADRVARRAQHEGYVSKSIGITLKFDLQHSISRQITADHYTNSAEDIYSYAMMLTRSHYKGEKVRLLGISLNDVIRQEDVKEQISLFDRFEVEEEDDINAIIKEFNKEDFNLMKASDLLKKKS